MVKEGVRYYYYPVVIIVITFIIALLFIFLGIRPLIKSNKRLTTEVTTRKSQLSQLEKKKEVLVNLKAKEAEVESDKEKIKAALPSDKDLPKLLVQITGLSNDSGLLLKSITLKEDATKTSSGESESEETISEISDFEASLNTTGIYSNFKDFLTKAENALRLVNINGFNLSLSGVEGEEIMDIIIEFKTYFKKD